VMYICHQCRCVLGRSTYQVGFYTCWNTKTHARGISTHHRLKNTHWPLQGVAQRRANWPHGQKD
jgi:hypothetical protein